jgi:uncharacterized protein (TIGR02246 family)
MDTATSKTKEEAQIRQLMENWADALKARDVDKMMANYAPDVLVFGFAPPLELRGADQYRKNWIDFFNALEGRIGYETRDLEIITQGDVAFSHFLNRINAKMKGSDDGDGHWMRVTVCFRKIGGRWLVTHEHVSCPIDGRTGSAVLDLEP